MVLASLTLCYAISAGEAVGSPMWPDCGMVTAPFQLNPAGGSYSAIGCTYSGNVTISASSLNWDATASMLVTGGKVLPGPSNGIGIIGPSSVDVAATMGSLHMTILNMTFGRDAMLLFAGTLPPKSSLVVEGNSFYITQPNTNKNGVPFDIVGIHVAKTSLPDNASITIQHNIFSGGSTSSAAAYKAISFESSSSNSNLALTNYASITVGNNTVANVTSATVCAVSVSLHPASSSATVVVLSNNSALNICNNRMINITGINIYVVGFTTPDIISVTNASKIRIIGNSATEVKITANGYSYAVYWVCNVSAANEKQISIARNSLITMSANSLTEISCYSLQAVAVSAVYLYWINLLRNFVLTQNASLEVNDNLVANVGGSSSVNSFAVLWSWMQTKENIVQINITNGSQISCSRNTLFNATLTTGIIVSWNWDFGAIMEITDFSAVHIDGNSLRVKTNMASWAVLVRVEYTSFCVSCP